MKHFNTTGRSANADISEQIREKLYDLARMADDLKATAPQPKPRK